MKTIIAGSRTITDFKQVLAAVSDSGFEITEVVSGGAPGVDLIAEQFAYSKQITLKRFPADWNRMGRSAGIIRNLRMAHYAEALIAVWDGKSKGTAHMIKSAADLGLKVFVRNLLTDKSGLIQK